MFQSNMNNAQLNIHNKESSLITKQLRKIKLVTKKNTHRDWRTILQSGFIESGPSTTAPSLVTVTISNWIK